MVRRGVLRSGIELLLVVLLWVDGLDVAPAFGRQNVNWHEPQDAIQTTFTKQINRGP